MSTLDRIPRTEKATERRAVSRNVGSPSALALRFLMLFGFWCVLSGRYDPKSLILGVLAAAVVTTLTQYLLYSEESTGAGSDEVAGSRSRFNWWAFLSFVIWMLVSIVKANLQLAYVVLHPRLPIDPAMMQFRTRMQSKGAQVMLANAITLTPGTATVDLRDGAYVIHALTPESADSLISGRMQRGVGAVLGEDVNEVPIVSWSWSLEELSR